MAAEMSGSVFRRELTAAVHARIRLQLVLLPVYLWLFYGWMLLLVRLPYIEPVRDFAHFYVLGVIAHERNPQALYDRDDQAEVLRRMIPGADLRFPPEYGPQVPLFFSPLARLSYMRALYVWLGLTLLTYAACCYAIWRVCPRLRDRPWTIGVLLVGAPALHFVLAFEQVSAIGLVCVTAAFLALRADRLFLAGVAIGSLAYKPPLGLAAAAIFVFAGEWRIVVGAVTAAAAQLSIGCLYWGPSILRGYVAALLRIPDVVSDTEASRNHMHSWRAFFDLLGLPSRVALAAYVVASVLTLVVAFKCWRARGPLALRYSVFLVATVLVDPHLYAYDLVLLTPAFLLLWDWVLAERDRPISKVFPRLSFGGLSHRSFNRLFQWLLYFCYLSPLFSILATAVRVQLSVLALSLLGLVVAEALFSTSRSPVGKLAPSA
jgi:hypothetical protein